GETAKKLLALGHEVQIVVPSPLFAERCQKNAPAAQVHECKFEDFATNDRFDLCLFSESYQYVPLPIGLKKALSLLDEGGTVLIADCFRSEAFEGYGIGGVPGGGHRLTKFRDEVGSLGLKIVAEEEITAAVAPSIDLEQGLFNVIGHAMGRVDDEIAAKRPWGHRALHWLLRRIFNERKRARLMSRLRDKVRTSEAFEKYNHYMIFRLTR
ncbi:MAG: SAM-dependent methyltransferase, partial [Paracoccaceae bacterium]|nr:SAM-dependent methyltransferase [Paracoccaceae bacterium]